MSADRHYNAEREGFATDSWTLEAAPSHRTSMDFSCKPSSCRRAERSFSPSKGKLSNRFDGTFSDAVALGDIVVEQSAEFGYNPVTAQGCGEPSIDVNRGNRLFKSAGE